ncbi:unnamed protein product, partial [Rotaria sp. Silwood2]
TGYIAKHITKTCYADRDRLVLDDLNLIATNKVKVGIIGNDDNKEKRIFVVKLGVSDQRSIQQIVQLTFDKRSKIDVLFTIYSGMDLTSIPNTIIYLLNISAIIQMTHNLALDLGSLYIRVNPINPGRIETPLADEQS